MPPKASVRGEYIETETGNKISRRASILGPKHIILAGKCVIQHDVVVHGDLVRPPSSKPPPTTDPTQKQQPATNEAGTSIHLGRYVIISAGCTLHPPSRLTTITPAPTQSNPTPAPLQQSIYYPLRISDSVYIGPNTHIQAAEIKSNVYIGSHCTVGNMCIIKENVRILDGTVLPPNSVWSSGFVVAGRPGRVVGEVGEGWGWGGDGKTKEVDEASVGVKVRERWALVGKKAV